MYVISEADTKSQVVKLIFLGGSRISSGRKLQFQANFITFQSWPYFSPWQHCKWVSGNFIIILLSPHQLHPHFIIVHRPPKLVQKSNSSSKKLHCKTNVKSTNKSALHRTSNVYRNHSQSNRNLNTLFLYRSQVYKPIKLNILIYPEL